MLERSERGYADTEILCAFRWTRGHDVAMLGPKLSGTNDTLDCEHGDGQKQQGVREDGCACCAVGCLMFRRWARAVVQLAKRSSLPTAARSRCECSMFLIVKIV